MQGRELRVEAHFAAGLLDLLADVAHDIHEQIGADVGFCLPQNLLGRSGFHEQVQDVLRPGAFDVRGQFAIRERSRPAFAVLDVGVRVERLAGVEGVDCRHALVDRRAALDHERAQTGTRKVERAEQAGRTGAHHDGARLVLRLARSANLWDLQQLIRSMRLHVRGAFAVRGGFDARSFGLGTSRQFDAERCHEVHIVLFARVDAALEQADLGDIARRDVKRSGRGAAHELFSLLAFEPGIERKGEV